MVRVGRRVVPHGPQDGVVVLRGPLRRVVGRDVRDPQQQVAQLGGDRLGRHVERSFLLAEVAALGLELLGLLDPAVAAERADLLRDRLDPGPDVITLDRELTLTLVELTGRDELGLELRTPAGLRGQDGIEVVPEAAHVDHPCDGSRRRTSHRRLLRPAATGRAPVGGGAVQAPPVSAPAIGGGSVGLVQGPDRDVPG